MKKKHQILNNILDGQGLFLWDAHGTNSPLDKGCLLFSDPVDTVTLDPSSTHGDVERLFKEIEQALRRGLYAAGWISYEAGYLLQPKLAPLGLLKRPSVPIAWFGFYERPHNLPEDFLVERALPGRVPIELSLDTTKEEFSKDIQRIHDYIRNGDTYQINYTIRGHFKFHDDPFSLYCLLRQRQSTGYGAFLRPFQGLEVLSLSPELFFATEENKIWSKPMKGTAPRGQNPLEDERIAFNLSKDEKNRAENVMIVDLLRNDLGRICQIGTVRVPKLFEIERYETLFQMTSTVEGTLRDGISWYEIFESIFPCGSITGAPKIRSMEIIAELEKTPRSIYTGAIGYITPQNSAIFNVAIRTITLLNGSGEIGIGAGITIGSSPSAEYVETVLKARFLTENIV